MAQLQTVVLSHTQVRPGSRVCVLDSLELFQAESLSILKDRREKGWRFAAVLYLPQQIVKDQQDSPSNGVTAMTEVFLLQEKLSFFFFF